MRIEYHRVLIADAVRLAAFEAALTKVIRPGETMVADIGTGSGVLAMIAARLGARRVFAYEQAEIGVLAERLVRLNGLRNVEIIPGRSTEMHKPPRVDVVVSETLGNFALEEYLIETMNDAIARHLKPGGRLIPTRISQFVCPVIASRIHDELTTWDRIGRGLDFGPASTMSLNNAYVRALAPAELLEAGRAASRWDEVDLSRRNKTARRGRAEWRIAAPAIVHGLAVWWSAELAEGVTLSTAPFAPATHWEQLYLPVLAPIAVRTGERLEIEIRTSSSDEGGTDIAWRYSVEDGAGKRRLAQNLSLEKGFLP